MPRLKSMMKPLSRMTPLLGVAAAALLSSSVAHANLVLTPGPTPAASFVDLGAQGFGAAPRLLTLQTNGFESGSVTPVDVVHGDAVTGANKSTTPTLSTLGWTSGAKELCAKVGDGLTG